MKKESVQGRRGRLTRKVKREIVSYHKKNRKKFGKRGMKGKAWDAFWGQK